MRSVTCELWIAGLSECKWGFYSGDAGGNDADDKRGVITTVNKDDGVPCGASY